MSAAVQGAKALPRKGVITKHQYTLHARYLNTASTAIPYCQPQSEHPPETTTSRPGTNMTPDTARDTTQGNGVPAASLLSLPMGSEALTRPAPAESRDSSERPLCARVSSAAAMPSAARCASERGSAPSAAAATTCCSVGACSHRSTTCRPPPPGAPLSGHQVPN